MMHNKQVLRYWLPEEKMNNILIFNGSAIIMIYIYYLILSKTLQDKFHPTLQIKKLRLRKLKSLVQQDGSVFGSTRIVSLAGMVQNLL